MITVIEIGSKIADALPIWVNYDPYKTVGEAARTDALTTASAVLVDLSASYHVAALDGLDRDRVAIVVDEPDDEAQQVARLAHAEVVATADVPAWLARTSN